MNETEDLGALKDRMDYLSINLDNFFLLTMGMVVFLMQCGFAFLEAGSVRSKNTTNILFKNILDVFIGSVSYWLFGFAFAFGSGNKFIGFEHFATAFLESHRFAFWFFQFVFAATAATIVSGSVAERCQITAYFVYSFFITGFIYPVITHWAWSEEGWLAVPGHFHDFAGSAVVHMTGGICALTGAIFLGPRIGRFDNEKSGTISGHSIPLAALGGFILLFGFLAFNGGSQAQISHEDDGPAIASAVINTILSGSGAGITSMLLQRSGLFNNKQTWSFLFTLNGALTGMVAACSGCDVMEPWGALLTGIGAGAVYVASSMLMAKFKIDDPLDAVAVHLGGGITGIIATPFFMRNGIFWSGSKAGGLTLGWNIAGGIVILLWAGGICTAIFSLLKHFNLLRVSKDMELKGMDILKHDEPAYPLTAWDELVPTELSPTTSAMNLLDLMRYVHSTRTVTKTPNKSKEQVNSNKEGIDNPVFTPGTNVAVENTNI